MPRTAGGVARGTPSLHTDSSEARAEGTRVRASQDSVTVDGARIYYQTRGAGPPLLIVQGGVGEAGLSEQLADALAEHYLVLSYDRRGLSRSEVTEHAAGVGMAGHADDAAAVLAACTETPAVVVGSSIGALIGLHLAVRHPERVDTLVAHEPPMSAVLRDPDREAAMDEVAALATQDTVAAIQRMAALTGVADESVEDGARPGEQVGSMQANLRRFFDHDFAAVRQSTLDADDLGSVRGARIVLTGGTETRDGWEHRCARLLAEQSGLTFAELPGGHGCLVSHPWACARKLLRLLGRSG